MRFDFFTLLCIAGFCISFWYLVRALSLRFLARKWTQVDARIIETNGSMWFTPGYVTQAQTGLRVKYEYVVAGQRYESNRVSPFDQFGIFMAKGEQYIDLADRICRAKQDGSTISAYYNPVQPQKSVLTISLPFPFIFALMLSFVVFAVMPLMLQGMRDYRMAHHTQHSSLMSNFKFYG